MSADGNNDLVVLLPGKDETETVNALLSRPRAIGTRRITWRVLRHPERDPGCLRRSPELLRRERGQSGHALVMFDREGSGREQTTRVELEQQVEKALRDDGWGNRAAAVVIDPELEAWVWSESREVASALGWRQRREHLRAWLRKRAFLGAGETKPGRPKEAMEMTLRETGKRRSSAIFQELARSVSVRRCRDPAFRKLLSVLQTWFPKENG